MVNAKRLEYLIVVAREGSFTRAAQLLHVAQPALSRQVRQLENELGVRLLERTSQGVRPTAAAVALIERSIKLLDGLEQAMREATAIGRGEHGALTIAYTGSASHDTAPSLLATLRAELPGVELRTTVLPREELLNAVSAGAVDVGIVRCPPQRPGLTSRPLRDEPQGVLARDDHPVFATGGSLSIELAADHPLLLHERDANPEHYDAILSWCAAAGLEPEVRHRLVTFDVSYAELFAGEAIAIVGTMGSGLPQQFQWQAFSPARTLPIALITRSAQDDPLLARAIAAAEAAAVRLGWQRRRPS